MDIESPIVVALTAALLAEHNSDQAAGTERESFKTAPIWMQRKAARLADTLSPLVQSERAAALREAADEIRNHFADHATVDARSGQNTTEESRAAAKRSSEFSKSLPPVGRTYEGLMFAAAYCDSRVARHLTREGTPTGLMEESEHETRVVIPTSLPDVRARLDAADLECVNWHGSDCVARGFRPCVTCLIRHDLEPLLAEVERQADSTPSERS